MSARVLVVDDLPLNVRVLEAKLAAEYFDVITAASGAEALEAVARHRPDIVLLDVMMPGMDGFETCRRLKANPETAHVPVIMVTALSESADRVQGLEAGADDFLTKPVDDVALFARVRSLVRLKLMTDELRLRERTSNAFGVMAPATPDPNEAITDARVLLIDDDARADERLAEMLRGVCALTTQPSPAEAMVQARGGDFDLIIVNLDYKAGDALRLCSQLRSLEETRQVPILLIAETEDRKRLVKGMEIGVSDYILRPIDRNEFIARTRSQVRRKRYQDRLRQNYHLSMAMAVTDALTGLYNRHYMQTHLENLLSRGAGQRPAALMMIDIDYFKAVNDTHGHAVGDEVLKEFANRLERNVRGIDLACRYGGEEFVVVMPDTDLAAAQAVAERLRRAVCETPFPVSGPKPELTVSCSIGVTSTLPADDVTTAIKRADDALYQAKRDGRNRVAIAA